MAKALYAVVADNIVDTGSVNYMFIFMADIPDEEQERIVARHPHHIGWLKTFDQPDRGREGHIFVFSPDRGMVTSVPLVQGSWDSWLDAVREMHDCVLLVEAI